MAYVLVNKDGTSNAKPGDTVIHGGGMTTVNKDGTKTTVPLPGVGATSNYKTVVDIMNNLTKTSSSWVTGGKKNTSNVAQTTVGSSAPTTFDSEENYDNFTTGEIFNYDPMAAVSGTIPDYSGNNGVNGSKIVGYGIVGLVLIAVLDKLIG